MGVTRPRSGLAVFFEFAREYPARSAWMVGLLAIAGVAEGFGVATLLPLLELAGSAAPGGDVSGLSALVVRTLGWFHLRPELGVLLALVVAGMVLKAGFTLLAMKHVGYAVARVSTDLRLQLLSALMDTGWGYFVGQPAGRLTNAIASEADRAAGAYRSACATLAAILQVAVYAGLAFLISWQIAVLAIAGGVFVVAVLTGLVRLGWRAGAAQTQLMQSLVARLTDALQGIKPIKAMGREKYLRPLLERETEGLNRAKELQVLAGEALKSAQEPLLVIMLALGLYFALSVGDRSVTTVLVMAFIFYRLAGRVSLTQIEYQSLAVGESALAALRETIRTAEAEREQPHGGAAPPAMKHGISVENITFSYGTKVVLENLSLFISAGSFTTIAGPSGAGKTTLLDLIVGLHMPTSGVVRVDGVDLADIDLVQWRRGIGYVPQEMFLFHDTVYENVTLGDSSISRERVVEALRAADAWSFVSELPDQLDTVLGERGSRLSGGQRQRIAIARALVGEPFLLVLDEVTTALDPDTEQEICRTLRALNGVTILAISHQQAMREVADYVLEIEAGRRVRAAHVDTPNVTSVSGSRF